MRYQGQREYELRVAGVRRSLPVEQVQEGILDMTSTSLSLLGNFGGEVGVFDLPYLFASRDEADKAAARLQSAGLSPAVLTL